MRLLRFEMIPLVLLAVSTADVGGQQVASGDSLRVRPSGQVGMEGEWQVLTFLDATQDSLRLRATPGDTILVARSQTEIMVTRSFAGRGTLVGTALGAVVGGVVGYATFERTTGGRRIGCAGDRCLFTTVKVRSQTSETLASAAAGGVLGGLFGLVLGKAARAWAPAEIEEIHFSGTALTLRIGH